MRTHLCMLFYILGFVALIAVTQPVPPSKMQTYSLAIPPLRPKFVQPIGTAHHDEVNCLAEAIYHEGRGESIKTQVMIAEVTINRARDTSKMFPSTICAVIEQRRLPNVCQYSWACKRHPIKEKTAWIRSRILANWLFHHYYLRKEIPDLTKGSLYFTTKETHRRWMDAMQRKVQSDDMKFLVDE